jgi:hypothetical protein
MSARPKPKRKRSRRRGPRTWGWAEWTRAIGLFIGLAELTASIAGRPVSAEVLAFAGGLIVAPNIAGAQDGRNQRRES